MPESQMRENIGFNPWEPCLDFPFFRSSRGETRAEIYVGHTYTTQASSC